MQCVITGRVGAFRRRADTRAWLSFAVAAAGLAALNTPAHAQDAACARAGWIARIEGRFSEVHVRRGDGDPIQAQPLDAICEGDRVEVQGAAIVHLRINGRADPIIVRDRPSGYDVPRRTIAANLARNGIDYFHDLILPYFDRSRAHVRMRAATNPGQGAEPADGPLRFLAPGLEQNRARISLTDQSKGLILRWEGGVAPFDIAVFGPDGAERYRHVGARNRYHDAASVALQAGAWRVRIQDGAGAAIEGRFVAADAPSPAPAGWSAAQADESLRVLWLARCRSGEWGFAALQLVGAHRSGSVPQDVMLEMLAEFARAPDSAACPA